MFISLSSNNQTKNANGLTQTILGQCLDRAYFCVDIDSIWQILGYCRNMYGPQTCSHITLLVYFFGAPHILFSCPVIKICVDSICVYQSVERAVSFPSTRGNLTFKLFIHFLPLNVKTDNRGDFFFLFFWKKRKWCRFLTFMFSILNQKTNDRNIHGPTDLVVLFFLMLFE